MSNSNPTESTEAIGSKDVSDANLVSESLAGSHEAFGSIVARYQTLLCSLAYSGIGNLSQSEDIAQEAFVTAWKRLGGLREPHKLRSWLCQIARNLTFDALRKQGREPSHHAESLEEVSESHSLEPLPVEHAMSKEEQEILWRSLERIPEIYREPLVLFYRENQSISVVAQNLELNEDAVKQRLSRGRKLLHEQVLAFVEGALKCSSPGKVFTLSVLAALPAFTTSAKAATIGVAAAKGGATAKVASVMGLFGAILSPLLAFTAVYSNYRMIVDEGRSDGERGKIKKHFRKSFLFALGFSAVLGVVLHWACRNQKDPLLFCSLLTMGIVVICFLTIPLSMVASFQTRRRYLAGILAGDYAGKFPPSAYEYRSRLSLFGLPLVHIRIGNRFDVLLRPVKAWIAIGGSRAVGVIFASGGIAVAPLSLGGVAIGLLPFGAISLGMFPLGLCSLGVWAYGALAIGWQTFGSCAVAWNAAMAQVPGVAVAHDFALGVRAYAAQANTAIARQFFQQVSFFRCAQIASHHGLLFLLGWTMPLILRARIVARARRRREKENLQSSTIKKEKTMKPLSNNTLLIATLVTVGAAVTAVTMINHHYQKVPTAPAPVVESSSEQRQPEKIVILKQGEPGLGTLGFIFGMAAITFGLSAISQVSALKKEVEKLKSQIDPKS
jgi:RNA polymerase sigma factor (sigma-70 family)